MDITSPSYMIGSWVFWGSIILPTMYLNSSEEIKTKDPKWARLSVLFGQFIVTGGLMALAPSVRPFLINPIPLISIGLATYVFKYSGKTEDKKVLQWVAVGSLALSVILPQLIVMVKKGAFVGGKYSGLEPGTMGYTAASFIVWAIIILQMLGSREGLESTPGTPTPGTVATPGTSTPGTVATPRTPTSGTPASASASNNTSRKTKLTNISEGVKKGFEDVSGKLGANIPGLGAMIPVIFKILVLVAFASVPDAREIITSPITPVLAVLGYIALRWLNIASTIEIVAIALVSFLPQLRTLILNPIPPIVLPTTFIALGALGTSSDKVGPLAGVVGFAVTMGLQAIQDALPTIVTTTGLTLETGTFFYNNFSTLAWYLVILPSTYFFLRGDPDSKPSVGMSRETKDIIQIVQAVLIALLAAGIQSFKGLFLNPTPPLAFILILGFHLVARFFNLNTSSSNAEFLLGLFTLFGYGTNMVVGDKIIESLYSGGFPEPPTVEVQEPQMPELQMGDPSPINMGGGGAPPP